MILLVPGNPSTETLRWKMFDAAHRSSWSGTSTQQYYAATDTNWHQQRFIRDIVMLPHNLTKMRSVHSLDCIKSNGNALNFWQNRYITIDRNTNNRSDKLTQLQGLTDRQTDKQTDRQTDRQPDRQTDIGRKTFRQAKQKVSRENISSFSPPTYLCTCEKAIPQHTNSIRKPFYMEPQNLAIALLNTLVHSAPDTSCINVSIRELPYNSCISTDVQYLCCRK